MAGCAGPLFEAAAAGDVPRLRELVSARGSSVQAIDPVGRTALFYAAREGHAAAVEELVRLGARVDASNHYGSTPLHSAAREGHLDAIQALLRSGAAVDAPAEFGQTALHRAAENGHSAAIAALVRAGAKVDAATKNLETPLHRAAEWGHAPAVQALLSAGADHRRRLGGLFGDRSSALELAQRHGHAHAASLLRDAQVCWVESGPAASVVLPCNFLATCQHS
jgi:ankyrin repeat protein